MTALFLRLTAGKFRGRFLKIPNHLKQLRPTQVKLRQAFFNCLFSLQGDLAGCRVLDLFSGSGALGFEALSRGASEVHFVERSSESAYWIDWNAKALGIQASCQIWTQPVDVFLKNLAQHPPLQKYDLILADPPYSEPIKVHLLHALLKASLGFKADCLLGLETENPVPPAHKSVDPAVPAGWTLIRSKNYGRALFEVYQLHSEESS